VELSSDARILLFIIIGIALFVAGRKFQAMLSAWQYWKKTEASVPGLRKGAYSAVGTMFRFGVIAAAVFVVAAVVNRSL
jgi:hypothetical protein